MNNMLDTQGQSRMESMKDLVTVLHLNEPYYVEAEKEDYILIPPKAGTIIKIPELDPVKCGGKYLNKLAIELITECGIIVQRASDIKIGNKRSYSVCGSEDGKDVVVQMHLSRDWNNPPNPLPAKDMWFVSRDTDIATPKYRVLKKHLHSRNFRVLSHECINRDTNHILNCHGSNNGESEQDNSENVSSKGKLTILPEGS